MSQNQVVQADLKRILDSGYKKVIKQINFDVLNNLQVVFNETLSNLIDGSIQRLVAKTNDRILKTIPTHPGIFFVILLISRL